MVTFSSVDGVREFTQSPKRFQYIGQVRHVKSLHADIIVRSENGRFRENVMVIITSILATIL